MVEQTGRSALTEMRRLLGMLRGDANEPLTPQPGLTDVPMLVGQLREAGLRIELQVDGDRRELPVGIELSAYRIVQEALTNALKYAGDARTTVTSSTAQTRWSSKSPTMAQRATQVRLAAATAWSACANGSPSTAAASRQAPNRAAASSCVRCYRSDDVDRAVSACQRRFDPLEASVDALQTLRGARGIETAPGCC